MPARAQLFPPAYPPELSIEITNGPAAANIGDVSVLIWWDTNVKSSSVVHYGISRTHLSEYAESASKKTHHSVKLTNLRPDTSYYFRVESARKGRDTRQSELGTFKTLPQNR